MDSVSTLCDSGSDTESAASSPSKPPAHIVSKDKENSQPLDSQEAEFCSIRQVEEEQRPKSSTTKLPSYLLTPVRMEDYDDESDGCGDKEVPPSVSEIQVLIILKSAQ
jgi:hypothetical protein